ncbi:MAG: hypothetical protein V4606_01255 [Patescibacteria group bacterium]
MRPHIANEVPESIWELFKTVRNIIERLPPKIETDAYLFGLKIPRDIAVGEVVPSCHQITRALAEHFPVIVHDGGVLHINKTGEQCHLDHSWLTVSGQDPKWIIDPWPLGVVSGPALFMQGYAFDFQEVDTSSSRLPNSFIGVVEAISLLIEKILEND